MAAAAERILAPSRNARETLPRSLVGRRPPVLEHSRQNRCAMEIDGERVLVDVGTFTNMKNERAVVLRHDGSIGIEFVSNEDDYPRPNSMRTALGPRYEGTDGFTHRDCLTVIGKVIEPENFSGITIDGEAA